MQASNDILKIRLESLPVIQVCLNYVVVFSGLKEMYEGVIHLSLIQLALETWGNIQANLVLGIYT